MVTPYSFASAMMFPVSGDDSARSHLETAWRDRPSFSASSSWLYPFARLISAKRWAISTFMYDPFRAVCFMVLSASSRSPAYEKGTRLRQHLW